jgi:hypothetical protein
MPADEERLSARIVIQLTERDLRALQAVAEDMDRPVAWVARRGIRFYLAQILEAEQTLARGDSIVDEMRREARERRESEEEQGE